MSSADISNTPKSLYAVKCSTHYFVDARMVVCRIEESIRGYRSAFRQFSSWCKARGLKALPASEQTERYAPATIRHRRCAVVRTHHLFELG